MFKKDEYIVLLGKSDDYNKNCNRYSFEYVYKQRENNLYLKTYLDNKHDINNGWNSYCFNKKRILIGDMLQ